MFGKKTINVDMIVPSSKVTLKTTCLRACNNDIEEAEKLYNFYIKDLQNLPDFDVAPPSTFQQAKDTIANIFNWADQNQDKIVGAYNFFQQMRAGQPIASAPTTVADVPPIPTE